MARTVQAQAQTAQESAISATESLELVRCLLRVSVYHVAFLRGLFPDQHFKGMDMANLDGMHIKMLRPKCSDSQRLVNWIEHGVHDAIKRMYVKTLYFGIASDPEGSRLIEEYVFNFTYSDGGAVEMSLSAKGKAVNSSSQANVNSVRFQVIRLMRMLVQLCNTLERVPDERYLFMKLAYYEHVAEDYEPPFFRSQSDSGPAHFVRKPFAMQVGNVTTNHHTVSLKLKSVLDGAMEDDAEEEYAEEQCSTLVSQTTAASEGLNPNTVSRILPEASLMATSMDDINANAPAQTTEASHHGLPRGRAPAYEPTQVVAEEPDQDAKSNACMEGNADNQPAASTATDATRDTEMDAVLEVKQYCLQRKEVDLDVACLHFTDLATAELARTLEHLVLEGVLEKAGSGQDIYKVRSDAPAQASEQEVMQPMRKTTEHKQQENQLSASQGRKKQSSKLIALDNDLAPAAACPSARFDPSLRDANGIKSTQGRASMFDGSLVSGQPANLPVPIMPGAAQSSQPQGPTIYLDSQHSNRLGLKRKASFVADPIHQKGHRTRKPSRLSSMHKSPAT